MTIPEILNELEPYTGRFPMKAMRAAVEQREAITPELLRVLETVADDPAKYAERERHKPPHTDPPAAGHGRTCPTPTRASTRPR